MEKRRTTIEFKSIQITGDIDDLSQECTAYMKTKQFMAKRIHEQQEEIEKLKLNIIYHSSKHILMLEMLNNLNSQIEKINLLPKENKENKESLDISNDNFTSSFVYEDNLEIPPTKKLDNPINCSSPLSAPYKFNRFIKINDELKDLRNENLELRREIEKMKIENIDNSLEISKLKTDKFILFNELNELVINLKRTDLDKLNDYFKKNISNSSTRIIMPCAKGIKYNIMSAHSQISKILFTDSVKKKLNKSEIENIHIDMIDQDQMNLYYSILNKTEEEFDNLLDKKLSKKSKSFFYS
jgi:hypothetical protein